MKRVLLTMLVTFLICLAVVIILASVTHGGVGGPELLLFWGIVVGSGVVRYVVDRRGAQSRI